MANPQPDRYFKFSTELFKELVGFLMPAHVAKVCLAVIGETYGFHRKEAIISLRKFKEWTRIKDKGNICRALRDAAKMNIIVRRDNGGKISYRFQKDYDRWVPLSPRTPIVQRDNDRCPTGQRGAERSKPAKVLPRKKASKDIFKDKNTIGLSDREACEVYFQKLHRETWGEPYSMCFGRDRRDLNNLLKVYSLDQVFQMIDRLLHLVEGGDNFYNEFSIPKLWQHRARLIQNISKSLVPELPTWSDIETAALDRVKAGTATGEDKAVVAKAQAKVNAYEKWREKQ